MLKPYACLLGATVTGLWQLAATSDDGTIPLPSTLALETDRGFVVLGYTQDGLSCTGPVERDDVRWETEPWLAMGRSSDAEEWLELVDVEHGPALPLLVTALTGWFADGPYHTPIGLTLFEDGDTFALILSGDGDPIVLMTTERFELVCTDRETARTRAERTADAMHVRVIARELRL